MFAWFYWDPNREIFTIPYLGLPVLWYGLLFATGFLVGYYIFRSVLKRYLLNDPKYSKKDLISKDSLKEAYEHHLFETLEIKDPVKGREVDQINALFTSPKVEEKCRLLFPKILRSSSYVSPMSSAIRLFCDQICSKYLLSAAAKAHMITERITIYIAIATVLGARFGHLLFYEKLTPYFNDPVRILKIWEGGLASHGAAIAIPIAIWIFSRWGMRRFSTQIPTMAFLDIVAVPVAFVGGCIRVGNFINQELLGTVTDVPWAVVFGHPFDGSTPIPRHPAQLYESLFYFLTFIFLFLISHRHSILMIPGRLIGLFFFVIFSFRFVIEFWKLDGSLVLEPDALLTMGQYLSLPFIILGVLLFFWNRFSPYKSK